MLVKNNSVYKKNIKLLNYLFDNCDIISVSVYNDQNESRNKKTIKIILAEDSKLIDEISNNYSREKIRIIYDKYKNNTLIFDNEGNTTYDTKEEVEKYRYDIIQHAISEYVYKFRINNWLLKYTDNLILKKDNYSEYLPDFPLTTTYYFKINDLLKKEILNKKSLFDFGMFEVENICFFNDTKCLLETVTHEELCWLYCYSEKEYKLYKDMGIEFVEDMYDEKKIRYAPYCDELEKRI